MADRLFDAEGKVTVDDSGVGRGLSRVVSKVRETVARVDAMEGTAQLKADSKQLDREVDKVRAKMRSIDRQRATATADMDTGAFDVAEANLKRKLAALKREKVEVDVRMGRDLKVMDRTLTGVIQRLRGVGRATPWQDVQKLGDALHNARVTLGPLSLSLRGLIVAMTTLAPLVTSLAGALGGLVATLGTAVAGAAGLGAAGLAAFGLQALGIGLILKPMIHDLGAVFKAQKAYNTAVEQYGAHSDQAHTAMEKVHATLKSTSPELRGSWKDIRALSTEWTRLTSSARPEFFKTVAEGIRTARDLLPTFAKQSRDAFGVANRGVRDWLAGLRTAEARNILAHLMHNANAALGPLMDGLGQLGVFVGRVFESFSRHFKPLAQDFRDWASGLADAAGNTKGLNGVVDELVASFRSWLSLIGAVGRLLANFFMAGSESGRGMLADITKLVNKWADFMGTKEGQEAVKNFLNDSWDTVKKLAADIGDLVDLVKNLADAGKPIVDWLLDAADDAISLANAIDDATGAGNELVTGLAGLIILKRAVGWASALMGLLGGGVVFKGFKALGKGALTKLLFPAGEAVTLGAALRAAVLGGLRGAGLLGAGVLVGELANGIRGRFRQAFDSAGVPTVIKDALTKAFDFTPAGQIGRALDAIKHPIDSIKKAWQNLGNLPGVFLVAHFKDLVTTPARTAFNFAKRIFARGVDLLGRFISNIPGAARTAFNFAKRLCGGGVSLAGHYIDVVTGPARRVFNTVKALMGRGVELVGHLIDSISGPARRVFGTAKSIFGKGVDLVASLVDSITGPARSIMSAVESIFHDISVTVSVGVSGPAKAVGKFLGIGAEGGIFPVTGYAQGTPAGAPSGDPVTPHMITEAVRNGTKRRDGGKVFAPKFINSYNIVGEELGNSEFVIPTNPAYRRRAKQLVAQAAAAIGVGFARGTAAGKHKHKKRRPRKVYSGSHYLAPVQALEDQIVRKDNALTNADHRYNTDASFMPMLDDNGQRIEPNIAWHLAKLDDLKGKADELVTLETQLGDAIKKAHNKLDAAMTAWRKQRPPATIKDKKGNRKTNPKFTDWANKLGGLQQAFSEVPLTESRDAYLRADDYREERHDYQAAKDEVNATQSAPLRSLGLEGYLDSIGLGGTLKGLNLSLAQASATIDDTSDDRAAQGNLANFWQSVIQRLGPTGDQDLLTEAYTNLASAREGGRISDNAPDIGVQGATFAAARDELFRNFGSNFAPASGGGGVLGAIASGVSSGVVKGLTGGSSGAAVQSAAAQGSAPAGKQINFEQHNTFAAPPPDPHTFTKSTAWEVQAL